MKKYIPIFIILLVLIAVNCNFLSSIGMPSEASTPATPEGQPSTTTPSAQPGLFRLVKSVKVTPVGNLAGGAFVRIGYVPGKDRIAVTFQARLSQTVNNCNNIFGQPNA